jgi:hypothetical protein
MLLSFLYTQLQSSCYTSYDAKYTPVADMASWNRGIYRDELNIATQVTDSLHSSHTEVVV